MKNRIFIFGKKQQEEAFANEDHVEGGKRGPNTPFSKIEHMPVSLYDAPFTILKGVEPKAPSKARIYVKDKSGKRRRVYGEIVRGVLICGN